MSLFDPLKKDFFISVNGKVPEADCLSILTQELIAAIREGADCSSFYKAKALIKDVGEFRFHGITASLDCSTKAEIISYCLYAASESWSLPVDIATEIFRSCESILELTEVVERVGYDELMAVKLDSNKIFFAEEIALAKAGRFLRGAEDILDFETNLREELLCAIDDIKEILEHNQKVLNAAFNELEMTYPVVINANRLTEYFIREKDVALDPLMDNEQLAEFINSWLIKIDIHARTGIGVFDNSELRLKHEELEKIREAFDLFPKAALLFRGTVLDLNFTTSPPGSEGALAGTSLGKVQLYSTVRDVAYGSGIFYPEGVNPVLWATVHELAHCSHTYCMCDFQRISGWIPVRNLTAVHPLSRQSVDIDPTKFAAGKSLHVFGENYIIAFDEEPEEFEFTQGISLVNTDVPQKCGWIYRADSKFVSGEARLNPYEDYAETLTHFLLQPEILKRESPEKYQFMRYLYATS